MTTFKTQYNRRSFLKVSAAAGGGLMISYNGLISCQPAKEERQPPKEWFDFQNGYVKVGDNGQVTILSPNPEIGQNVKTSMPMIVAEELEVAWEDVIVEQAALNTNWYDRQVAGGSQSIRQEWESLRMAGATAKQMLVMAAAQQWEVEPSTCKVSKGVITNASGDKLTYGEVASVAAKLEVPEEVTLKDPKDFTIIGTDRKNVEIDNIITGKPLYGIDTKVEGMKYAAVMRAPSFGQRLVDFDDSEAMEVEGVEQVFSFTVPQFKNPSKKQSDTFDKIAVIANSTWAAMKGKKALKANWKQESSVENTAEHDKELLALFDKKVESSAREDGNVRKAFAEADQIVEKVYESPFLPHSCMEPMNFFADATGEVIKLNGPIQTPAWARSRVISMFEMVKETGDEEKDKAARKAAEEKVEVQMTRMGGGFGRRLFGDFVLEAAKVSKMANAPVQLVFSREDDMMAGIYRPAIKYKIRAAIKSGEITGYHLAEAAINDNMYGVLPNNFPAGAIENYQVDLHDLPSNITTGAWRAPYTNFLASAEQSFFDELAEVMQKDAVELRLEILEKAKATYDAHEKLEAEIKDEEKLAEAKKSLLPKGNYEPDRFIGVIKLAAEKAGWGNAPDGVHLGFSVYYSHNSYVAEVAHLRMNGNTPKVEKVTCAVDCGLVVNPIAASNLVEGGVVDGIGHSMFGDFIFENGQTTVTNFDQYRLIRTSEAPKVEVFFVDSDVDPTGLGEPTLPPAGAAVANAIYKATGKRLYKQPYIKETALLG